MRYILLIIFFLFFFLDCNFKHIDENFTLEKINRRVYSFNRGFDNIIVNSSINVYIKVTPNFLKENFNNFFYNLSEIYISTFSFFFSDSFLFFNSLSRFFMNTIFGFFGFFDISKHFCISFGNIDFFLFLKSNYIFYYFLCPFVGPGFFNSHLNLFFFKILDPFIYFFNNIFIYMFFEMMVKRSVFFIDIDFFHKNILDGYSFLKDIYLQNFYFFKIDFVSDFLSDPTD